MVTWVEDNVRVSVPAWVTDIDTFHRWMDDDSFPEHGRIWWLCGEVWVDMSKEQIFTHVLVKTKFTVVLGGLAESEQLGMYLVDGALLSNFAGDLSGNPDGLFLSNETQASDRIRMIEGKQEDFVEIQGTPDMVLEIVSTSSEDKDEVTLRQGYWDAGIPEYWLVDARRDPLRFDILRRGARGYTATRKNDGWVRSQVFGRSFRLTRTSSLVGQPDYRLEVR